MRPWSRSITPPHQALAWIPAVYDSTEDLKRAGQRIVYLTNPHVGHLGIFVSASVVRLEHRAILESLDEITALAPGLYEMKIDNPSGDPDCHKPQFSVRFEPRRVEDLQFDHPREAFERVERASELNDSIYRNLISPWIGMAANPWTAEALKWLHPMRTSRYLFADAFNPWMRGISALAGWIAPNRQPLAAGHPFMKQERVWLEIVADAIQQARERRDASYEQAFALLYERPENLVPQVPRAAGATHGATSERRM